METKELSPSVAQLAVHYPGALTVFTRYNIDYCCGGHRTLNEVCSIKGLDPGKVLAEIRQTSPTEGSQNLRLVNWPASFLADFIVANHHAFVKQAIPELEVLLEKVCDRHGNDCYELLQIRESFLELSEELLAHMEKEEEVLFPAIKSMENHEADAAKSYLHAPILAMEDEHEIAGELIRRIRTLSGDYTPPAFACPTFCVTYQKLKEFDADLMQHIHLENNILFPRFKEAQKGILN